MAKEKKDDITNLFKDGKMKSMMAERMKEQSEIPEVVDESDAERQARNLELAQKLAAEGKTQWDLLKDMMDGELTEKFIAHLQALPPNDFIRNYLKLLEHFKPKLVRADEGSVEKPDTIIQIETVIINQNTGEQEIIDITALQGDEKIAGLLDEGQQNHIGEEIVRDETEKS